MVRAGELRFDDVLLERFEQRERVCAVVDRKQVGIRRSVGVAERLVERAGATRGVAHSIEVPAHALQEQCPFVRVSQIQRTTELAAELESLDPGFVPDIVGRQFTARPVRDVVQVVGMALQE